MNKKMSKLLMALTLFFVLMLSISAMTDGLAAHTNNVNQVNNANSTSINLYSVNQGQDLIYNITTIINKGSNYLPVNDSYGNPVGNLTQGNTLAFSFQGSGNNGTYDYVNGSVRSVNFQNDAPANYFFNNPNYITTSTDNGPPLLYFVYPNNTLWSSLATSFTNAGFYVSNANNLFSVGISYFSTSSTFSKPGSINNGYNTFLNATWDENTGFMKNYSYNFTGSTASVLKLDYLGTFNPDVLMPYFSYQDAALFYNFKTLQVNNSNKLSFNNQNDPQDNGYFQQGQNVLVNIHSQINSNGISITGDVHTQTGQSIVDNPYENSNTQSNGLPDLFFLFPISQNSGWWSSISLELKVMGLNKLNENSTSITFRQLDPNNANNYVTVTFNKTNGALSSYNMNIVDGTHVPGINAAGTYKMQLTLLKVYNMNILSPYFKIQSGNQYRYHIDTLNFNGSTSVSADQGTFQQGQDMDILFNQFSLQNGPEVQLTMSTKTGQSNLDITYDIFNSGNGPIAFFPILPINTSSHALDYFGDVFHYLADATITNTATIFGISVKNLKLPDMVINQLTANWNKTNGLLINYNFDAYNPNNTSQIMKFSVHFVGESNGQTLYNSTLTTTPGFEYIGLAVCFICIAVISKKRNLI